MRLISLSAILLQNNQIKGQYLKYDRSTKLQSNIACSLERYVFSLEKVVALMCTLEHNVLMCLSTFKLLSITYSKQFNPIYCMYPVPFNVKTQSSVSSQSKKHQLKLFWVCNNIILSKPFKQSTKINFQVRDYSI